MPRRNEGSNRRPTPLRRRLAILARALPFPGLAGLGLILGMGILQAAPASAQDDTPGRVLKIYSVGGVLTEDGTLWQYTPQKVWRTIDEAFREQGKETHILPLPVPAESIADMVTFGFLFTTSGECWLYDLEADEWTKLDPPR